MTKKMKVYALIGYGSAFLISLGLLIAWLMEVKAPLEHIAVIDQQPILQVSPSRLEFSIKEGETATPLLITITNTGKGRLEWQAQSDADWLSIDDKEYGVLIEGQSAQLTISIDMSGLQPGTQRAQIIIMARGARGSPIIVPVELTR